MLFKRRDADGTKLERGLTYEQALDRLGYPAQGVTEIAARARGLAPHEACSLEEPGYEQLLAHLSAVKNSLTDMSSPFTKRRQEIDESFDFLSTNCWEVGFLKALCHATGACVKERGFLAAVATVRNEGPFIIEWIAHHQAIGIRDFFVYTNDNSDGSLDLLRALADVNIIRLIENTTSIGPNPQVKAYEHALYMNLDAQSFKWLVFLDADELTIPAARLDFCIERLIREASEGAVTTSSISLNWMWMGSGGAIRADLDREMSERFTIGRPFSLFVKSIVRPQHVLSMRGVHKPVLLPGHHGINSAGNRIDMSEHSSPFCFAGGEIRHYWNKSFEEFLVKQARGADRNIWERETGKFFEWDATLENGGIHMPFPAQLAQRSKLCAANLRALPSVRAAENRAKQCYAALAADACGKGDVEKYFDSTRRKLDLQRSLRSQAASTFNNEMRLIDRMRRSRLKYTSHPDVRD